MSSRLSPRRIRLLRQSAGLTLIELMVVLTIAGLFATIAAPSFRNMLVAQRLNSASSAITESLWKARSEALKRNASVGFNITNVDTGWNIVVGGDTIHSQEGFGTLNSSATAFQFNATGRLTVGAGDYQLSDKSGNGARCLTISGTGKVTSKNSAC